VKALNEQVKELKEDMETLKEMLKEKQREMGIQSGKYELTIKDLNEDLDEAHRVINIMIANKEKLILALSDKNKELEEKEKILRKNEEKLKSELEEVAELSTKLRKKENSIVFGKITLMMVLVTLVFFAFILRH